MDGKSDPLRIIQTITLLIIQANDLYAQSKFCPKKHAIL